MFFPLPFMAITAATKIIMVSMLHCMFNYYLIEKGNSLLHQVIVTNLPDECPISYSS